MNDQPRTRGNATVTGKVGKSQRWRKMMAGHSGWAVAASSREQGKKEEGRKKKEKEKEKKMEENREKS